MAEEEKQTCGRRMSEYDSSEYEENLNTWHIEPNGDRRCSFCGSIHLSREQFEQVMADLRKKRT